MFILFVIFPAVLFNGIATIKKARASAGEGTSLRKSELEALVRQAVADAQAPLLRRVETLEAIATDDLPGARLDDAVLGEALDAGFDDALVARDARRRARG